MHIRKRTEDLATKVQCARYLVMHGCLILDAVLVYVFFFSSRRRHTRLQGDWSSDVCSSDLGDVRTLQWTLVERDECEQSLRAHRQRHGLLVADEPEGAEEAQLGAGHGAVQIGRASCRERV